MLGTIIPARRFAIAMVRRMLQVDLPASVRTDEDVEAEVWRNYNWNFAVNVTDGALLPAVPESHVGDDDPPLLRQQADR